MKNILSCKNCSVVLFISIVNFRLGRGPFATYDSSVTRLGEISPLRQKFKSFWPILEKLFSIWHNCVPTLSNILHFCPNFHCSKKHYSHLVTRPITPVTSQYQLHTISFANSVYFDYTTLDVVLKAPLLSAHQILIKFYGTVW